jgi:protein TonB
MQAAASTAPDQPQAPVAASSASSPAAIPAQPPTWLPDTTQREQPPAQPQAENVTPPESEPRRSAIPVGKLATPIAKTPVMASLSEPPPVLLTQDNGAAEGVLRSGVLSGASRVEAPAPPPAAANSLAHPGGGQLQMPRVISSPDPLYPTTARAQSVEGVVVMDALVDAVGNVAEVKVISGPVLLRQAAMDALRRWKYQPARLDGQPTAVHTNVNIRFALH